MSRNLCGRSPHETGRVCNHPARIRTLVISDRGVHASWRPAWTMYHRPRAIGANTPRKLGATMSRNVRPDNSHPVPDRVRLTHILDETLTRTLSLRRAGVAAVSRLRPAGVPPLTALESERRRRLAARSEAAA
jgi:hypothetical protein